MGRIIKRTIHCCAECNKLVMDNDKKFCMAMSKEIGTHKFDIPEWCPLEKEVIG